MLTNAVEKLECRECEGMPFTMYGVFCLTTFASSYKHEIYSPRNAFSHRINWHNSHSNCTKNKKVIQVFPLANSTQPYYTFSDISPYPTAPMLRHGKLPKYGQSE